MSCWLISVLLILAGVSANADTNKPNLNDQGAILDGYDAVSYRMPSGPVKGSSKIQAQEGKATYWFSSEANKTEFLKNIKKYRPEFEGWCAYAVAVNKTKVEVDPKSFLIQKDESHPDGRLLVFYKGFLSDTRKKWQTTEGKDAAAYLKQADANWPATQKTEP